MAALQHGVRLSQTSPAFLHANSTSHTWTFSAIAEIIDNAYDPDVSATKLLIDRKTINGKPCLVFTDNGAGMEPEKLHRMLSFGYCEKIEVNGHKPVGHYGNGFKSGSMRLGKDAMVFTKSRTSMSVGYLSQTYLMAIAAETVLVPIVTYDVKTKIVKASPDSEGSLDAITSHSLFRSRRELRREFEELASVITGTRIVIYNLKRGSDARLELDFESNPRDIINSEHQELDIAATSRPIRDYVPEYRRSLREYCSILFLKPRMHIMLRGHKVKTKLVAKSLRNTEKDVYRPHWLTQPVPIIFGFGPSKLDYGLMLYHRNRLIKAFEPVGCQKQQNDDGVGVVGVVQVDFLEPIHNKQDFNKTDRFNACLSTLGIKLNDYWNEKTKTPAGGASNVAATTALKPDWTWAQCENCLKWRRLPDGHSSDLPEKWYCYINPDPVHNRCDVEEEPEDEDELFRATYEKTYKKTKEKERVNKFHNMASELQMMKTTVAKLQTPLPAAAPQGSAPTIADLERAKKELEIARQKEHAQAQRISQLQEQQERVQQHMSYIRTNSNVNNMNNIIKTGHNVDGTEATTLKRKAQQKVAMRSDDFVVTENTESSDEEDPASVPQAGDPQRAQGKKRIFSAAAAIAAATASAYVNEGPKKKRRRKDGKVAGDGTVIVIDSDEEGGPTVEEPMETSVDTKPNIQELNKQINQTSTAAPSVKAATNTGGNPQKSVVPATVNRTINNNNSPLIAKSAKNIASTKVSGSTASPKVPAKQPGPKSGFDIGAPIPTVQRHPQVSTSAGADGLSDLSSVDTTPAKSPLTRPVANTEVQQNKTSKDTVKAGGNNHSVTVKSASAGSKLSKSPQKDVVAKKVCTDASVQTEFADDKVRDQNDGPQPTTSSSLDADKNVKIMNDLKSEVEKWKGEVKEAKDLLKTLRTNVSAFLKTILPELDISNLEYLDDIVLEMVKVNSDNCETASASNSSTARQPPSEIPPDKINGVDHSLEGTSKSVAGSENGSRTELRNNVESTNSAQNGIVENGILDVKDEPES